LHASAEETIIDTVDGSLVANVLASDDGGCAGR